VCGRSVTGVSTRSAADRHQPTVAIIGAGFGGVGMAISLRGAGFHDVTIFEKADSLGGVWRDNTYPGAACDVPSSLYSYSFEPNTQWPRRYSRQDDILAYLRRTARKYRVDELVRFGTEVVAADFDETTLRWRITTADGSVSEADVLVPAMGQLSRPSVPDLPGADTFTGRAFHSARWAHDVDLTGKRVAVIGTGASAIQFVPEIAPLVGSLTVFQRSAPYVVPKPDRGYRPWHHRMFRRLPPSRLAGRFGTWGTGELLTLALTRWAPLARAVSLLFEAHLRRQVPDARLRAALRPDYRIGCKRLLFSNNWFPALRRPNVRVVTEPVTALTPTGVRSADGVEHPVDVVVYGTGFLATQFLAPVRITGVGGRDLAAEWSDGAHAYLGMAVPGFPNMFIVYGPNTNLGGNSIIYMMERQYRYVRQVLRRLAQRRGGCVQVRRPVADAFDREVQGRLAGGVWSGCHSWYHDDGARRIPTNWPGLVWEYGRRTRRVDFGDYEDVRAADGVGGVTG
jgi:cation diffusion facilitator CzcD-associated flavoprotein CzcO